MAQSQRPWVIMIMQTGSFSTLPTLEIIHNSSTDYFVVPNRDYYDSLLAIVPSRYLLSGRVVVAN